VQPPNNTDTFTLVLFTILQRSPREGVSFPEALALNENPSNMEFRRFRRNHRLMKVEVLLDLQDGLGFPARGKRAAFELIGSFATGANFWTLRFEGCKKGRGAV
jgi:hypothetical protein